MNEIGIVFSAETLRKLRSRLFWLATLGGMLGVAVIVEMPAFFANVARSTSSDIVLAGPPRLRALATPLLQRQDEFRVVASVDTLPENVTAKYLDEHGKAGAAIAISTRSGLLHLEIYPRDLSAFADDTFRALVPLNIELATGVSRARIARASRIDRTLHAIDKKFSTGTAATLAHGVAMGLVFTLYLAIILASQSVMAAVAEEKTSRIAEILVATIEPGNLLAGKTLAAAAIAIAQLALWILTAIVLLPHVVSALAGDAPATAAVTAAHNAHARNAVLDALLTVDPGEVLWFLGFFVVGYLQYATIYAAAASLISRTEDLASVTTPVIMPVVGAFFLAQYALLDPNAPLVVACGFVPFLSPFVMFARISIASVPLWQTALAFGIDALTVVACFWSAGRVYRLGMLLYGKLPSPRQVLTALRS
jgi:ABC-2 type transport system permease protein